MINKTDIFFELFPFTNNFEDISDISIVEKFEWDSEVNESVEEFNKLYSWNEMFDESEFKQRIQNKERFFIFKENQTIVGHVWHSSDVILFNPKRIIKTLENNSMFAYNVFVNKNLHSKSFDSSKYYSTVANKLFNEGIKRIIVSVDSWNTASLDFSKRIGMTQINNSEF